MRQLLFEGPRAVRWVDRPEPSLTSSAAALVRPLAVSTCDMDAAALSGAIRFRPGTPLGHEGVGVVIDAGEDVRGFQPGDRVIIPWQVSCGMCGWCRRGQDTFCENVPPGSCYGWGPHVDRWGAFLADTVLVPFADHQLVPLPEGLDPSVACGLADNLVDAWRSIGPPLREAPTGRVLVVGGALADGGSIGLYACAFAAGLGADEVVFVGHDPAHCSRAARLGARPIHAEDGDYPDDVGLFDVTVDTSGSRDGLAFALRSTGPAGICTCTAGAVHRGRDTPVPLYDMYMRAVTLRTGWVPTRALIDEPLALLTEGLFDPRAIATQATFDEAVEAFAEPFTKLILERDAP